MKRYTLDPSIIKLHQSLLSKNANRYQYPIYNQSCKTWNIGKDVTNFSEILYTGRIPSRIIVAMVASDAFNGTAAKDRLTFEDFGLVSSSLSLAGDVKVERTLKLDPANKNVLTAFHQLLDSIPNVEQGLWIDRSDFLNGSFMLAYQLSPAGTSGIGKLLTGQLKLELLFNPKLTQPVELLVRFFK